MKKKITNSGRGNQMRISSYDYRAWDKFDVVSMHFSGNYIDK